MPPQEEVSLLPKEEAAEPPRREEPTAWLLVLGSLATVLFGASGTSLPRMLQGAEEGKHWYRKQLSLLVTIHITSGCVLGLVGRHLAPQIRSALREAKAADEGNAPSVVEHRWDTLKWTLTMLVSLTHFTDVFEYFVWRQIYGTFKEFFLMETYMFVSGYLSTPVATSRRLRAIWKSVAGAYFVNQLLFLTLVKIAYKWGPVGRLDQTFKDYSSKEAAEINMFEYFWYPFSILYYLADLIMARIAAPTWMELRYPLVMSFVLAVCVQYGGSSGFFALTEFFAFFPYYILGITVKKHARQFAQFLEWKGTRVGLALGFMLMFVVTIVSYGLKNELGLNSVLEHTGWFDAMEGKEGFDFKSDYSGKTLWFAWYDNVGGIPLRFLMIAAAISLFGGGSDPVVFKLPFGGFELDITQQGKNSMANYILHYYLKFLLAFTPLFLPSHYGIPKILLICFIVFVQANFWMWPPVQRFLKPIFLAPNMDFLLAPPEDLPSRQHQQQHQQHQQKGVVVASKKP
ncbi:hypothetical protein CTAYLR_000145 [Chrysophaeum taylorii]|uniref:Uncharacterized protein n=1 Tax=Chrysophaeum taylorii TaxID=2483200 RepID=A0AAD7UGJ1_9STRA|nr:hypothetical protein CTAYLR_000145 [Chrysophaeum taylorii]